MKTKKNPNRTRWVTRFRKGSMYWSGMSEDAKGWCIYSKRDKEYFIRQTGVSGEQPDGIEKFGPFESFEAAKAAFTIIRGAPK